MSWSRQRRPASSAPSDRATWLVASAATGLPSLRPRTVGSRRRKALRSALRTCARGAVALLAALALTPLASAEARSYTPPPGHVFNSGIGGYGPGAVDAFGRQAGKHPAVYQYFVDWTAGRTDVHWLE